MNKMNLIFLREVLKFMSNNSHLVMFMSAMAVVFFTLYILFNVLK